MVQTCPCGAYEIAYIDLMGRGQVFPNNGSVRNCIFGQFLYMVTNLERTRIKIFGLLLRHIIPDVYIGFVYKVKKHY